MSANYRTLRRAIDDVEAAELGVMNARQKLLDAEVRQGAALKACREYNKLSLREVARRLKVSAVYLSDVEHGRRRMRSDNMELILDIVGPPSSSDLHDMIREAQNKTPDDGGMLIRRRPTP